MDPGIYNFTLYQGATFGKQVVIKNAGVIRNINGYTARMQIRDKISNALVVEMTTENGKLMVTGTSGRIDMILSATETMTFNFITALYDLEIIAPDSTTVERILQGEITLDRNVTR